MDLSHLRHSDLNASVMFIRDSDVLGGWVDRVHSSDLSAFDALCEFIDLTESRTTSNAGI